MLSSVLRGPNAIAVYTEIMRAFVRLRRASVVSDQLTHLVTISLVVSASTMRRSEVSSTHCAE